MTEGNCLLGITWDDDGSHGDNDDDDVDGGSKDAVLGKIKGYLRYGPPPFFFLRHYQTSWSYKHAILESYVRQV